MKSEHTSVRQLEPNLPRWIWCLVANVREKPVDELFNHIDKARRGTKHFAPGTLVYVYPVQWGDGWERMVVVGKKRGTHRYIRKVMPGSMLEGFRLKKVYSPTVISWMRGRRSEMRNRGNNLPHSTGDVFDGWGNSDCDRETIEMMADSYRRYSANPEAYLAELRALRGQ